MEARTMSTLLGFLEVVYGGSLLVAGGGGILYAVSPRFRRELLDDTQSR
jgi:hypothetical protein